MELNALLGQPAALPSLPRTVALLMNELAQREPSLRRLNLLFGSDPVLAARLLELANAPAHQLTRQVAGISEALVLLGSAPLQTLVSSATLGTAARAVQGINLQQFWRYSLHTAKLARSLAGVVFQNPTAAYTAGLLHGLGELLIHLGNPQKAQSMNTLVLPLDMRRGKIEQRILGYSYSHVSAALAQRWLLPQVVVDALQYQAAPFENTAYEPLAGVIHLAAWRVRGREAGLSERELAVTFPGEIGLMLGLDIDMVLQQDPIDWTVRPDAADYLV
ncbi:HDOD domain-containing protein [Acidovorax sp. IB03]|uniref:HDOD domain-containing protein n=1 Tax=Acidovorax sp. IB03 TaxID=2779366 RepID=UPI0018E757A5|nr:HDOD domain-containing protein [Acidovorax sp. IB03]MBJ2162936.1 HDOD domain-containing protein [Acidovorax sp. IB03]